MKIEKYDGKINEFVDWVTGDNSFTGQNESEGKPISGRAIRELLQERIKNPFVLKEDVDNNLYRMFSSETAYQMWLENPSDNADLELFNFVRPSDYKLNITINSSNKFVRYGDSSNIDTRIQYTWSIRNDEGESPDSLVTTYTISNEDTGKTTTFTRYYNKGQVIDFSIYEYLQPGTNVITISGKGFTTGARSSITYNIILLQLNVISTFDFTSKYNSSDNILIQCTLNRNNQEGTARVKFIIDEGGLGKEWYTDILKNTGTQINASRRVEFAGLDPGQHTLQIYAEASYNDGSVTINSNLLYYTFMIATDDISIRKYICIKTSFDSGIFPINNLILHATQYMPSSLEWGYYTDAEQTETLIPVTWRLFQNEDDEEPQVLSQISASSRQQAPNLNYIPTIYSEYDEYSFPLTYLQARYNNTQLLTIPIQIVQNSDITVYETGLYSLKLSAYGKTNDSADRDSWEYNSIETTFTGVQWNPSCGWYDNSLRLCGQNNYAYIDHTVFQNISEGKTIEIEFETEKVNSDDDILIRIGSENNARIEITPVKASLFNNSNVNIVHTNYKSNERLKLAFIINPQSDTPESGLAYIVNNGILERASDASDSIFTTQGGIKIGGSNSGIRVYKIRVYDYAITYTDEYNNFVYDNDDKIKIISRNNILDSSGKINFDLCKNKLDTILISGNLSNILSGQTDKDGSTTDVTIERICPYDSSKNFKINNIQIRKHGQSTLNYPITSMKFWMNKSSDGITQPIFEITPQEKLQLNKNRYRMKDTSIPANKFILQANYADSSGVHNGGLERLIQDTWFNAKIDGEYKLRTLPQLFTTNQVVTHTDSNLNDVSSRVDGLNEAGHSWNYYVPRNEFPYQLRISPDSFPCVVFYYDENGTQERTFLGQYVFMEDKKSDFNYGERSIYKIPTDPFCLTVTHAKDDTNANKIWNNNNTLRMEVLESNNTYSSYMSFEGFTSKVGNRYGWESAFEMIYPDPDDIISDDTKNGLTKFDQNSKFVKTVQPFINWYNWLTSTRNNYNQQTEWWQANTYASGDEAFRATAAQHLDLYKLAAYYIFCLRFGLVDSMERNVQIKTYDGQHFHYEPWDMDIALGNKNDGGIAYDPPINRDTKLPGSLSTYAFSGKSDDSEGNPVTRNWLFQCLENWSYWMNVIVPKVADALYIAGLKYENITQLFDEEYANSWCEVIYNKSGFFKYIESSNGDSEWLNWLQGSRLTHRHWWLSTSMDYYDAMWFCGDYKNHYIYITANVSQGSNAEIHIIPNKATFMTTAINYMNEEQEEITDEGVVVQGTQPVSPNNPLSYVVPNLNTKAPFFVYGANFMETINLSEIATGLDAVDVNGCYSDVLGSQLKEINIGISIVASGNNYTGTAATLGGAIRGSAESLANLQTLNIRGQRNFNSLALVKNRNLGELKNIYAMGSGLNNFFSSEQGNSFVNIELPSTVDLFEVNNSTWTNLQFWSDELEGSTLTMSPYEMILQAGTSNIPPIHTLRLLGTSCQNYNSLLLVRNWLKSIVASGEDLGNFTLEADKMYWTEDTVGSANLLTYDELSIIAQLNVNNSEYSIKDSLKGYIVLKNENDTQLTTEQLTQIRSWFGDTVFVKSSSGLVIDHKLSSGYIQINLGGDIYMQNNEYYIREGGRASISATEFALAESNNDNGIWTVSYANVNNVQYSTSGISERGISIISAEDSADGINYLQTSESQAGGNYDIKIWYTSLAISYSTVIHVVGVIYPDNLQFAIDNTGIGNARQTNSGISITVNGTVIDTCVDLSQQNYTATLQTIKYSLTKESSTFIYDTMSNNVSESWTDLNLLVSPSVWSNPNTSITKGTKTIRISCPSGVPQDDEILLYQLQAQLIFKSRKIMNVQVVLSVMKDDVIIRAIQSVMWDAVNTRWNQKYGENAPSNIRRSDLMTLDGTLTFGSTIANLLSQQGDSILRYFPAIQGLIFDNCSQLTTNVTYDSESILQFDFSNTPNLETLSIQNCTGLTGNMNLSNCSRLNTINSKGTTVNIILSSSVNPLTTYSVGSPSEISINNPTSLTTSLFSIDSTSNLTSLELTNVNSSNNYGFNIFGKIFGSYHSISNLTIIQNNNVEVVTFATLHMLYQIISEISSGNVYIQGNISTSGGYQNEINYLTSRFNGGSEGTLTISATKQYVNLEDSHAETFLTDYIGDGIGVTLSDMTNHTGTFNLRYGDNSPLTASQKQQVQQIQYFRELVNFTNISSININLNASIVYFSIPPNITGLGFSSLALKYNNQSDTPACQKKIYNLNNVTSSITGNNILGVYTTPGICLYMRSQTSIGSYSYSGDGTQPFMLYLKNVTYLHNKFNYGKFQHLVINNTTPPTYDNGTTWTWMSCASNIYVPSSALTTYQDFINNNSGLDSSAKTTYLGKLKTIENDTIIKNLSDYSAITNNYDIPQDLESELCGIDSTTNKLILISEYM